MQRLREQRGGDESLLLGPSLQQVVDTCVELFGVTDCGIMLMDEHGDLHYVVAKGIGGRDLEQAQTATGHGPCVETVLDDKPVASTNLMRDDRWGPLAELLAGSDLRAVLAVPLRLSGMAVGSLNVACDSAHDWSVAEREALSRYAEVTESMLVAAVGAEEADALVGQLSQAIAYRAPIERGVGYLMARDGIDQAKAFHRLRLAARSSRRRIVEVSEDLQATGLLPGEAG